MTETIEKLVSRYQRTGDPDLFRQIYDQVRPVLARRRYTDMWAVQNNGHELAALYDDALLHAVNTFSYGSFLAYLGAIIKWWRASAYQRNKRRPLPVDIDELYRNVSPIRSHEDTVIARMTLDQIRGLDGVVDDVLRLMAEGMSMSRAAKTLGVHHVIVRRKLNRIRRAMEA